MKLHREGNTIMLTATLLLAIAITGIWFLTGEANILFILSVSTLLVLWGLVIQFFRVPHRTANAAGYEVVCPADGKIVVIEKVFEPEFLNEECIQVSIFMSPLNVHANWYPISGKITYYKYHKGKYLVAWHPKSSTENERTTIVIDNGKSRLLVRQIAGAVARRIVCYSKEGDNINQGSELGFIKFGSRVDVFLPVNANIKVQLEQKVKGLETILAELPK
ncbi:MAG: phosphatidylserine decarboxylase family protein [Flavobacteriales bacterium]